MQKKKLAVLLAAMVLLLVAVAAPAMADKNRHNNDRRDNDRHDNRSHGNAIYDIDDYDIDDDYFLGYYPGIYSTVGDVDYKNVRERNWRDGECFVTDVDQDGFIAEYDYTCYY
jgi:hypothetical protein